MFPPEIEGGGSELMGLCDKGEVPCAGFESPIPAAKTPPYMLRPTYKY
jgi:hypothetical protein